MQYLDIDVKIRENPCSIGYKFKTKSLLSSFHPLLAVLEPRSSHSLGIYWSRDFTFGLPARIDTFKNGSVKVGGDCPLIAGVVRQLIGQIALVHITALAA